LIWTNPKIVQPEARFGMELLCKMLYYKRSTSLRAAQIF